MGGAVGEEIVPPFLCVECFDLLDVKISYLIGGYIRIRPSFRGACLAICCRIDFFVLFALHRRAECRFDDCYKGNGNLSDFDSS